MASKYRRLVCHQMGCHRRSVRYLFWHTFLGNAKAKEGEYFQFKAPHCGQQRPYHLSNRDINLRPNNNWDNNHSCNNSLITKMGSPFRNNQHNGCLPRLQTNKSLNSHSLNLEGNTDNSNQNSSHNADIRYL